RTSFSWGIPVPGDEKHVIYVWLDALSNYITALGWGSGDPARYEKFWPANLHLVGKEITRFHCVYWPAFLLAAGLPLPESIHAHGWLLFEESKMSKSRGNIVRSETILDTFGGLKPDLPKAEQDRFGADVLRYFLLREIVFGQDGSFSFDALVQRYNADLANGYGNLVSRTLAMISKRGGQIPKPTVAAYDPVFTSEDVISYSRIRAIVAEVQSSFDSLNFSTGLAAISSLIALIDGYISRYTPWKLVDSSDPDDQHKANTILYTAAEGIRVVTALLYPVMPYSAARVWEQLGLGDIRGASFQNLEHWGDLPPGTRLGKVTPLFPRADKEVIARMNEIEQKNAASAPAPDPAPGAKESAVKPEGHPSKLRSVIDGLAVALSESTNETATVLAFENALRETLGGKITVPPVDQEPAIGLGKPNAPAPPPAAPAAGAAIPDDKISIDDFLKVELRVAQVKVAERVPKADKLLRLEVDLGNETRQILAGIAESYTPESLIGRKVVIVANLAPRKLRGLESNGMIVAASTADGKAVLAGFLEDVEVGAKLK
ncbi:MAG TPA: methionine--tRNA ligase subunit beta, partial [Acidobacteriaceae bacterium]|nr:methionine--tRNA ligase subunit beta [Acidobacteriaceae bacterium]